MDHAEPGAGQHRDGKFGDHRQVQGHPVPGLQAAEVTQQRGELVHLPVQLPVADVHRLVGLELAHEDDRRLVRIGRRCRSSTQLYEAFSLPPASHRQTSPAGVQRRVPRLVPGQQVGVLPEALGELVLGVHRMAGSLALACATKLAGGG